MVRSPEDRPMHKLCFILFSVVLRKKGCEGGHHQ